MAGEITTVEETGTGAGGDEILHQNVDIDGNQIREVKTLVEVFRFIDGFKIVQEFHKYNFLTLQKYTGSEQPATALIKKLRLFINKIINRIIL